MNTELRKRVGEALHAVLSPFHAVDGCPLKSVWQTVSEEDVIAIQLDFEPGFLTIELDSNDDTVDLSLTKSHREEAICVSYLDPWRQLIGKHFGWGWLGINQQGYLDGVSFSFQSVIPQYCITAIASSLRLTKTEEILSREHTPLETGPLYGPAAKYA